MKQLILSALLLTYIFINLGAMWRTPTMADSTTPDDIELSTLTTPTIEPTEPIISISAYDATLIAKTLYGEARGCSVTEQSAVAWCILNRVDSTGYGFGGDIEHVITFPNQFLGYSPNNPVLPELYDLAVDVLTRWEREKQGVADVGRVLPREFKWFSGDGGHNWFRDSYSCGNTWGWTLESPYEATP